MAKKKVKKNWFRETITKVKLLPWYWKTVFALVLILFGGSYSFELISAADTLTSNLGYALAILIIWILINLFSNLKIKKNEKV